MNNQRSLDLITNSFIAASKIRDLKVPQNTRDGEGRASLDNVEFIFEILKVISDYSPEKFRQPMSRAVGSSRRYVETYSRLRQHLGRLEKPKMRSRNFVDTLNVIKPVLGTKEAIIADKIVKIYDILRN